MSNNTKWKVLVVDDEHPARVLLSEYVQKIPALELVEKHSNALDAMQTILSSHIDILLIDIQMPDLTGLDLVKNLKKKPITIFTTAYSEYALESYELEATDYLLKPISFSRFLQAINKAIEKLSTQNVNILQNQYSDEPRLTNVTRDYLVVKADHRLYKVNYIDLVYIEGQREYVTFHTKNRKITALYSLKELENQLPEDMFIRIHKSYIISFRYLETLEGNFITLSNVKLPIGASYRDMLIKKLEPK